MISIDTIELTTNTAFIKGLDSNCFIKSIIDKPNGVSITNYSLYNKPAGINNISINETFETVKIKASSKILKDNYADGISLNTLDQFIYELNDTGLELDTDFINDSKVTKIDIKNDLHLTKANDDYLNSLNQLIAPKFVKSKYDSGIVFKEKIASTPSYLTMYDKQVEIAQNKNFYHNHPEILNSLSDTLRIEGKLNKSATVKKYFNTNDFINVLNSDCNLNHLLLYKVIDKQNKFKADIDFITMSNTDQRNYAFYKFLNDYYSGDFNAIMKHIKSGLGEKTKASYQRIQAKKYLAMINNATDQDSMQNIKEIQNALKER